MFDVGYLQVIFVSSALRRTINQFAIKLMSPVLEEYTKPVKAPGAKKGSSLKILWGPKELREDQSPVVNHVAPLIQAPSNCTFCKSYVYTCIIQGAY